MDFLYSSLFYLVLNVRFGILVGERKRDNKRDIGHISRMTESSFDILRISHTCSDCVDLHNQGSLTAVGICVI
jgi:hypothetical protein